MLDEWQVFPTSTKEDSIQKNTEALIHINHINHNGDTMSNELVRIEFQGQEIEAIFHNGDIWVLTKRICENLEVTTQAQQKKLREHHILSKGTTKLIVPSKGGDQETQCIKLDFMPMWLTTIHPKKVSASSKKRLEAYQFESVTVLRDHFLGTPQQDKLPTIAEHLLQQAQVMVGQEKKLAELKQQQQSQNKRVVDLERKQYLQEHEKEETIQQLRLLPPAQPCLLPERTTRHHLCELVRGYAIEHGGAFKDSWNKLYREYRDRAGIDLKARAKNKKSTNALDVAEELDVIEEVYSLASELFKEREATP